MKLDPLTQAALALHYHPGRYALLLGSGISRAASIPTGWEITLDLVKALARAQGEEEECTTDPKKWYIKKYDKSPDYSELLHILAKTPHERQSLLRKYFEPTGETDAESGDRAPTSAHKAIAKLLKSSSVKLVITLNFDRLLEESLAAEGVHVNVLSSNEDAEGMIPLNHGEPTLLKLHGDYRDPRIRNTTDELSTYPEPLQTLLTEILERYGLIVCGWSSDWDTALRDAICSTTRHRYQTFWMTRGDPSDYAESLIAHREAVVIPIQSADQAFEQLHEKVASLEYGSEPEPVTPSIALNASKRYISNPSQRIRLHDLLLNEVERTRHLINTNHMPWQAPIDDDSWKSRVLSIESATANLIPITSAIAYHDDGQHDDLLLRAVTRLLKYNSRQAAFDRRLKNLSLYPAALSCYSIGISCILQDRYDLLLSLLSRNIERHPDEHGESISRHIASMHVLEYHKMQPMLKDKPSDHDRKTPASDWMAERMWPALKPVILDQADYDRAFDLLEFYIALICTWQTGHTPVGRFAWQYGLEMIANSRRHPFVAMVQNDIEKNGGRAVALSSKAFDGSVSTLQGVLQSVSDEIARYSF